MKDPRARFNPLVFQDRESGVTQTGVVEQFWALQAIRDVVKAAETIGGVDIDAKVLDKLKDVVETSQGANAASLTPPKPWIFDENTQNLVLPDHLNTH